MTHHLISNYNFHWNFNGISNIPPFFDEVSWSQTYVKRMNFLTGHRLYGMDLGLWWAYPSRRLFANSNRIEYMLIKHIGCKAIHLEDCICLRTRCPWAQKLHPAKNCNNNQRVCWFCHWNHPQLPIVFVLTIQDTWANLVYVTHLGGLMLRIHKMCSLRALLQTVSKLYLPHMFDKRR